jgi:hypothetical protein
MTTRVMSLLRTAVVLLFATLAACGARTTPLPGARSDPVAGSGPSASTGQGGSAGARGDAGAPGCTVSVLRSVPEDHATDVPLTPSVHVEVGCLEPDGVLPALLSLTVSTGGTPVFGYSTVQGSALDFYSASFPELSLGAIYTVQVLANERPVTSFQFTSVEGRWQPPERVTTLRGVQQNFAFSVNAVGEGVIAYSEEDADTSFTTISARFFDVINGLAASSEVAVPAHHAEVHSLRIGLDTVQGAALTWVEYNTGQYSVLAALDDQSGWTGTQQISSPASVTMESLGLVVSGNSQRALLWKTSASGIGGNELLQVSDLDQLGAAPFTVASGVGTATADLAFDTNGLFVVWDRPSVNARYRQPGGGWGPPAALGSTTNSGARIAAGWGGSALVVFPVSIASDQTLSAHYYAPSSGWADAQSLDTQGNKGTTGVSDAAVAVDAAGNALAIWTTTMTYPVNQADAGTSFNIDNELRSQRYDVESGWVPTHDTLDVGATSEQALALVAASGNGFVVGVTPSGEVRAARFRAGSWQPSVLLDTLPTTTYAAQPKIVVDGTGRATAIWRSDLDLMIRRFSE